MHIKKWKRERRNILIFRLSHFHFLKIFQIFKVFHKFFEFNKKPQVCQKDSHKTRDLYSPDPQTRDYPPSKSGENTPQTNPKIFGMFQMCIKLQKSSKMREIGKKSILHWDFCMLFLKFSQKFQILINFSPKRPIICCKVSTFVRIINNFQLPTLIIIKISFLNKKLS